jgi:SNF2 family DNA or RNA helicase
MEQVLNARMLKFSMLLEHGKLAFNQHQYDGVRFCINNELTNHVGIKGGFIVDEMGLGKTITMIGTILSNYVGNTLIVLPPILVSQWAHEIKRTTGHAAIIYHGPQKKKITKAVLEKAPIVLTTYNGIHEIKNKDNILHEIQWARVVFDEAHHLRNATRSLAGALKIKANIRWLISGTPIQNCVKDFYNLCRAAGITKDIFSDSEMRVEILNSLVLRRTKKQVGIQIPDMNTKHEIVYWSNDSEKKVAEEIHATLKFSNVLEEKISDLGAAFMSGGSLQTLMRTRQSCTMPMLMEQKVKTLVTKGQVESDYLDSINHSSKLDKVIETIVSRKDNGAGKLVFCQYHREMDTLARRLREAGLSNVATFDGRNTQISKQKILNGEGNVLILQIQTGCEGLNLQAKYSEVYFVSPHWNPSVEDQAVARCHRIGQKKEVNVFKFEMDGFGNRNDQSEVEVDININNLDRFDESLEEEDIKTMSLDHYILNVQNRKRGISNKIFNNS